MRPILVQTGPWQWWAYPIIVAVLALFVALIQWLETRSENPRPFTAASWLVAGGFVLAGAALVLIAVNRLAPVHVHSYGVMLLVGLIAGVWWLTRSGRPYGFTLENWIDFALVVLLSGVAGARLLYILLHWAEYAVEPVRMLYLWQGGLAFHGGLGAAIIGGYVFARVRKVEFALLADLAVAPTALGYAFTRIGCFLNGCCYGHECHVPWAVTFPAGTEAGAGGVARHPTQLYAVAANLIIFAILVRLQPRIRVRGNLFFLYVVLYSVYRFIVEFFRRGATANIFPPLAPLTEAQTASIIIGLVALVWMLLRRRAAGAEPA